MINFNNEWLWLGNLGQAMVWLLFVTALVSTIFYYSNTKNETDSFKKWARISINLHLFSVVSVFAILFLIIFFHRYEFYYAWRHSSNSLPVYYMISCFWEGQEGSFLLWIFWNAVILMILKGIAGKWESPVMMVISFGQIVLTSMILGIEFGDFKIGSSPFNLLREARPEFLNIPILGSIGVENYLDVFKDGNGLNKLLQNYWMVIHPPTLFLGFALAIVPFAYSIASFWNKEKTGWLQPALMWSLACTGILGAGIIMGGFWAYESLSFGGYWAWDPVENASLLPWLIMISAVHMVLISRNTGRHLFTSHLLIQLTFWLVLYATFLTRSGILGEASVHSFTDLGLSGQLLLFLLAYIGFTAISSFSENQLKHKLNGFFILLLLLTIALSFFIDIVIIKWFGIVAFFTTLAIWIRNLYKNSVINQTDEKLNSREFWMFLGSMFMILSLIQVFSATSIPVFNKLWGFKTAVPGEMDYNRIQLWMAMPIMALMAIGQYFRYRESKNTELIKDISITVGISLIVAIVSNLYFNLPWNQYFAFYFLAIMVVTGNLIYWIKTQSLKLLNWGSSLTHIGFGILMVGVLISSVNKTVLTSTENGIQLAPEQTEKGELDEKGIKFNRENRIAYQGENTSVGEFQVTYLGSEKGIHYDSLDEFFQIQFTSSFDSFVLIPKTQNNPQMGLLAEPDTRHYISRDIFTHINYQSGLDREEPFSGFLMDTVSIQTNALTSSGKVQYRILTVERSTDENGSTQLRMPTWVSRLNQVDTIYPQIMISEKENSIKSIPVSSDELGLFLSIESIKIDNPDPSQGQFSFIINTGEKTPVKNYVVLKIVEFPWINLVWFGTIIMVIGFTVSIYNRQLIQRKLMS